MKRLFSALTLTLALALTLTLILCAGDSYRQCIGDETAILRPNPSLCLTLTLT
jgi:hypothetical protein